MSAVYRTISLGCRLFLAWLFIYASYDKVWDPAGFAVSVGRYEVLPLALVQPLSVWLAWTELLVGLLLLAGLWVRAAAVCSAGLLAMFTGLMIYAWVIGAGYDCGCFPGQGEAHAAGLEAAVRDILMLLPALWLIWRPSSWLSLDRPPKSRRLI